MKKTGKLLPTISQLPSCVYNLMAKPRTSRTVSALPRLPRTVEKRTKMGVSREVSVRTEAVVRSPMLSWSLNFPNAPEPRAWTTRSGILSWSNLMIWARVSSFFP